jgi:nucleoside-diphosphate-sugar epimerase
VEYAADGLAVVIVMPALSMAPATYLGTAARARSELGWRARDLDEGLRDTVAALA